MLLFVLFLALYFLFSCCSIEVIEHEPQYFRAPPIERNVLEDSQQQPHKQHSRDIQAVRRSIELLTFEIQEAKLKQILASLTHSPFQPAIVDNNIAEE